MKMIQQIMPVTDTIQMELSKLQHKTDHISKCYGEDEIDLHREKNKKHKYGVFTAFGSVVIGSTYIMPMFEKNLRAKSSVLGLLAMACGFSSAYFQTRAKDIRTAIPKFAKDDYMKLSSEVKIYADLIAPFAKEPEKIQKLEEFLKRQRELIKNSPSFWNNSELAKERRGFERIQEYFDE